MVSGNTQGAVVSVISHRFRHRYSFDLRCHCCRRHHRRGVVVVVIIMIFVSIIIVHVLVCVMLTLLLTEEFKSIKCIGYVTVDLPPPAP